MALHVLHRQFEKDHYIILNRQSLSVAKRGNGNVLCYLEGCRVVFEPDRHVCDFVAALSQGQCCLIANSPI